MRTLFILFLVFTASLATAKTPSLDVTSSLTETEQHLSTLANKSPNDQFALGMVHFLRGIEKSLQTRWQHNMTLEDFELPVLRLPITQNPKPAPFRPELITEIFAELLLDMAASNAALSAIPKDKSVGLNVDLMNLWFDVNMNGRRDAGESALEIGAETMMARGDADALPPSMVVRFDTADAAWLAAYTHLLSGISELVIAFDPTEAISQVLTATAKMDALRGKPSSGFGFFSSSENEMRWIDMFAMVYGAINEPPDPVHTRAAHAHFLQMIADNKRFWRALEAETDDVNEWIPNASQTAALGFSLPAETASSWQSILSDGEAILNGELLITYWRIAPAGGLNVEKLFMDPPVVDIVTWFQGYGLLPYMERGPVATGESIRQFQSTVSGNSLLFSILLN